MEQPQEKGEKSYIDASDEEIASLPTDRQIAVYIQKIDREWARANNTNSENTYWSCIRRIEEYKEKLTTLGFESAQ